MILGIAGRKRAGKDSACEAIRLNHRAVRISFADPIKDIVRRLWGFNNQELYGNQRNAVRHGVVCREACQVIGTDIARKLDPNVWVRLGIEMSLVHVENGAHVIIPDVRFQNEVDAINEAGGQVWHVSRPYLPNDDTHESERNVDSLTGYARRFVNVDRDRYILEVLEAAKGLFG